MDISSEAIKPKLLSEPCWIDLGDDISVRVEYPSQSQATEFRRLEISWNLGMAMPGMEHWIGYYFRSTVKEVKGLTIDGKAVELYVERGLARSIVESGKDSDAVDLDVLAVFSGIGKLEIAVGLIRKRLEFTDTDKKKS